MSPALPFTNSNSTIKTFRHALSLDEHRAEFRPNLYHRPSPTPIGSLVPETAGPTDPEASPSPNSMQSDKVRLVSAKPRRFMSLFKKPLKLLIDALEDEGPPTDLLEVWFAGCHADVGGSAVPDSQIHALSNISLRWMVREVMKAQCGIQFDEQALARASIPNFLMKHTTPHDEQLKLDAADASDPIHDELKINPVWWILEILPTHYSWQDDQGVWHKEWNCHLGRGRKIQAAKPKFHITVKQRMADPKLDNRNAAMTSMMTRTFGCIFT